MKKVYLKKEKRSSKFNVVFPANVPLEYSVDLGSVKHPEHENIWLKV